MAYGESRYSEQLFSVDSSEGGGSTTIEIENISKFLPDVYDKENRLRKLLDIIAGQLAIYNGRIEDARAQLYVDTATWSLARWESELGLTTDLSKSYAWRREMIKAKLRGAGTTTPEMIQRVASVFSGGEATVSEVPGEYRFIVRFVGILGIPPNMTGLMQILEEIKPAHLAYEFAYTYTYWATLKTIKWNAAAAKTWEGLRTYG